MALAFGLVACGSDMGGGTDSTKVTTLGNDPVADAGPDQDVTTGHVVTLDGSGSYEPKGGTLSYSWSFTSKPTGSTAALSNSTAVDPTFTADKDGSYVVSLTVYAGSKSSAPDVVEIRAASLPLSDTGQTACYDASGNVIDCTATGQDGEYSIYPMNFTDNGDGTVTDNITGLMWQQGENAQSNWYMASGTYEPTYNPSSTDVCGLLTLGSHSDWRMPTRQELMRIVNYGAYNPSIDVTYFPNTISSVYWTSNSYATSSALAWGVEFYNGGVYFYSKATGYYVRCVRGQASTQSFTDNGNGTVTDNNTGFMWQKCSAGQNNDATCSGTASTMVWQDALDYCNELSLAGHTDWRLPNHKELESITDDSTFGPAIDTTYFPNTFNWVSHDWWTSTTFAQDLYNYNAFRVTFADGSNYITNKAYSEYVRCVR